MADINRVTLVGRLTADAQLKYTNGGMAICEFSVAVNNRRKQGDEWVDEANFFDVTLFGRQGEAIQRYLTKGKQIGIDGRLKQDRWQTNEGQNRSKVTIIAENAMLLGGGPGEGGGDGGGRRGGTSEPGGPGGFGGQRGGAPRSAPGKAGRGDDADEYGGGYGSADAGDFPDDIPF